MIVAYHTGGNYERHAEELLESALPFGLPISVWRLPDLGDWCKNCSQKAGFIRDAIDRYGAVTYVDADARFRKNPQLLLDMPNDVDFACHRLDGVELLSGTLYFSGSERSLSLVNEWQRRCEAEPDIWDQRHLDAALMTLPDVRVFKLPETYCRIFDRFRKMPREEIVIEHLQASRVNIT